MPCDREARSGVRSRALIIVVEHAIVIIVGVLDAISATVTVEITETVRLEMVLNGRLRAIVHQIRDAVVIGIAIVQPILAAISIEVRGTSRYPSFSAAVPVALKLAYSCEIAEVVLIGNSIFIAVLVGR